MNILVTINKTYIKQLNILLNSIQQSNQDENFNIYILYLDLPKNEIEKIKKGLNLQKISINLIQVPKSDIDFCPVYEKRYPLEIYLRIFAEKYLPKDIDRVLYLDADTLVINKLDELYNMDFEENYYIATTHIKKILHKFNEIRLNITEDEPYINTGVLLINLKKLRELQLEQEIIKYIQKNKNKLMLPDQDVITAMFGDKIKLVDELKYNLGDKGLNLYNLKHSKNPINLKWVCKNTVIIHYYGKNKPWNEDYFGILGSFYHKVENKIQKLEKVLILSCGTGGGHNSAAKAVQEMLVEEGITADFKEYLEIINPKIKEEVNKLYLKTTQKNGKTFKTVYKLGEAYQKIKIKSPVYALNKLSKKKLYTYIKENEYSYIITTHLFAAQALTAIKKEHKIKFIGIATDYVSIPFWEETNPNYLIIPSEELKEDFKEKGIKENKLIPLGIPVRKTFSEEYNINECKNQLNLKQNEKYILILTGSMGFGNVKAIVQKLEENIKNANIIIACGTNNKLKEELEKTSSNRIITISYKENIDVYMKSSDVILTKPGGLTTTEVATLRKPLIHTMPIPGCENYNANFFAERKMSIKCETIEDIIKNTKIILEDEKKQQELIKNQNKYIDKNATKKIVEFIKKEIK